MTISLKCDKLKILRGSGKEYQAFCKQICKQIGENIKRTLPLTIPCPKNNQLNYNV